MERCDNSYGSRQWIAELSPWLSLADLSKVVCGYLSCAQMMIPPPRSNSGCSNTLATQTTNIDFAVADECMFVLSRNSESYWITTLSLDGLVLNHKPIEDMPGYEFLRIAYCPRRHLLYMTCAAYVAHTLMYFVIVVYCPRESKIVQQGPKMKCQLTDLCATDDRIYVGGLDCVRIFDVDTLTWSLSIHVSPYLVTNILTKNGFVYCSTGRRMIWYKSIGDIYFCVGSYDSNVQSFALISNRARDNLSYVDSKGKLFYDYQFVSTLEVGSRLHCVDSEFCVYLLVLSSHSITWIKCF